MSDNSGNKTEDNVQEMDFYENARTDVNDVIAKMSKCLDCVIEMRMETALMETELTAILTASVWKDLEELTGLVAKQKDE